MPNYTTMQVQSIVVMLSSMSMHEVEQKLTQLGLDMVEPPPGYLSELQDATIPYERLMRDKIPGSLPARLAWAEWYEEFREFPLMQAINVTAWRLKERDCFMAAWGLMLRG